MKRIIIGLIVVISVLSIGGCTIWTNSDNKSTFFDGTLSESISFEADLSGYDQVQLDIDLSVSSVKVESIKGDTLIYEQKANKKELLADLNTNKNGKTLELHFKNDQKIKLTTGTQNSEVIIRVPEGIEVVYTGNVGVGDTEIVLDDLSGLDLDVKVNVGKIIVSSNDDQVALEKIVLSTDVGEIKMDLKGDYDVLDDVRAKSNTGSVKLLFGGNYSESILVNGQSDVGEVYVDFSGTFDKAVDCKVNSSVGDVTVRLPKSHEVVLDVKTSEFTSNLEIKGIEYSKNKDRYMVSGDQSKFSVDLSIAIGDALIEYSN